MAQRVRIPHRGRKVLRLPHNSPFWQHFTRGSYSVHGLSYTKKGEM